MNRTRRMFNAFVEEAGRLIFVAVFAVLMVPHSAFAQPLGAATVHVDNVTDFDVTPTSFPCEPHTACDKGLPLQAEVVGAPGNLGRAKVGRSPSSGLRANGVAVGVETRTRGDGRNASASADFSDVWGCVSGSCASAGGLFPPAVSTGFRVHGVIDDLLGNLGLPIDQSFLELFIRYIAFNPVSGEIHENFELSLCYDAGPCGISATLNGTDISNSIQIGTNALGQTTLTLVVTHVSVRNALEPWSDELSASATIQTFGSTVDHVLDFLSTFDVDVTSLDPNVVWESLGGRVSALSVVPFADLSIGKLEIKDDEFEARGSFTLGAASDGIDPLAQDVTLQVGTYTGTIPAGSFKRDGKRTFKFEGVVAGVTLKVEIRAGNGRTFEFRAEGEGANLNATVNPVTVGLGIGNDGSSAAVTAKSIKKEAQRIRP